MDIVEMLKTIDFVSDKWVLIIPGAMMFLDFATGFLNAWANHSIKSGKMRIGLVKKLSELIVIVAVELLVHGTNIPRAFLTCTSAYIIIMEFISIVENAGAAGFKIPKFVLEKFHIFNGGDTDDRD